MYYMLAQQAAASQPYWLVLVLALFASGSITALLNYWFNKRKTHAEVEKVDAEVEKVDVYKRQVWSPF